MRFNDCVTVVQYDVGLLRKCSEILFIQEWNDMNLRWNTSDFGGVKDLRVPPHRLWKPDVLMYNRYVGVPIVLPKNYLCIFRSIKHLIGVMLES